MGIAPVRLHYGVNGSETTVVDDHLVEKHLRAGWSVDGRSAEETRSILEAADALGVSAALGLDVTDALIAFGASVGVGLQRRA